MRNPDPIRLAVTTAAGLLLSGCLNNRLPDIPSPADLPIVYKIDVQQGNVITQEMLAQLQPGMDKTKVKYIMGTPLVVDVFHQDRWDYVYTMQRRGGNRVQRRVSLYFKDDKLDKIVGNVKPAAGEIAITDRRRDTTVEVPGEHHDTLIGRLQEKLGGEREHTPKDEEAAPAGQTARADQPGEAPAPESAVGTAPPTAEGKTATEGTAPAKTGPTPVTAANDKAPARKTAEVVVPDNAPKPPEKGFFRRLLEKVGVGDNEEGEYNSADKKYKDPSNPDTAPAP